MKSLKIVKRRCWPISLLNLIQFGPVKSENDPDVWGSLKNGPSHIA